MERAAVLLIVPHLQENTSKRAKRSLQRSSLGLAQALSQLSDQIIDMVSYERHVLAGNDMDFPFITFIFSFSYITPPQCAAYWLFTGPEVRHLAWKLAGDVIRNHPGKNAHPVLAEGFSRREQRETQCAISLRASQKPI